LPGFVFVDSPIGDYVFTAGSITHKNSLLDKLWPVHEAYSQCLERESELAELQNRCEGYFLSDACR
jgi:hypothetical protein